jgi:hypothetical protein
VGAQKAVYLDFGGISTFIRPDDVESRVLAIDSRNHPICKQQAMIYIVVLVLSSGNFSGFRTALSPIQPAAQI